MLTINLADNSFKAINKREVLTVEFNDLVLPCATYQYTKPTGKKAMSSIADMYDYLTSDDVDCDDVLGCLIEMYMPIRLFQNKGFAKVVKVIGLIGKRGSGKSASASHLLSLDWLIHGKPVYSNMDIAVRVVYRGMEKVFESQRIDKLSMLSLDVGESLGGVVFIDEINMAAAESTRHMSGGNLEFSYALQQIRKMGLSVVWTSQGWEWVDARVRWQTDYCILCSDCYIHRSYRAQCYGDKCLWKVCDISGVTGLTPEYTGHDSKWILDYEVWEGAVWNKPFWAAYDTMETQKGESYVDAYREDKAFKKLTKRLELTTAKEAPVKDLVERMVASDQISFFADDFWAENKVTDPGQRMSIGRQLKRYFHRTRCGDGRYRYDRKQDSLGNYYSKEYTGAEA